MIERGQANEERKTRAVYVCIHVHKGTGYLVLFTRYLVLLLYFEIKDSSARNSSALHSTAPHHRAKGTARHSTAGQKARHSTPQQGKRHGTARHGTARHRTALRCAAELQLGRAGLGVHLLSFSNKYPVAVHGTNKPSGAF